MARQSSAEGVDGWVPTDADGPEILLRAGVREPTEAEDSELPGAGPSCRFGSDRSGLFISEVTGGWTVVVMLDGFEHSRQYYCGHCGQSSPFAGGLDDAKCLDGCSW